MKEKTFVSNTIKNYYTNIFIFWIVLLIVFFIIHQYHTYISYMIFFILIINILSEINSRNIEKVVLDIENKSISFYFFNIRKKWSTNFNFTDIKYIRKEEAFGQSGVSDYLKFNFSKSEYLFVTNTDFSSEELDEIENILKDGNVDLPPLPPESFRVVNDK